jgi:SPP1 family predicted phage head-tail adaptor
MIPTDFLRSLAEGFMPESAEIQRPTDTTTGDGTSRTWATVATVSARLSPNGNTAQERDLAAQLQAVTTWRIAVPVSTDVTPKDRVVISGRTFEVAGVLGPRSYEAERILIAVELT